MELFRMDHIPPQGGVEMEQTSHGWYRFRVFHTDPSNPASITWTGGWTKEYLYTGSAILLRWEDLEAISG